MPDLLGRVIVGQIIAGPDLALRAPDLALNRCLFGEPKRISSPARLNVR
jgi:hypothetical protein